MSKLSKKQESLADRAAFTSDLAAVNRSDDIATTAFLDRKAARDAGVTEEEIDGRRRGRLDGLR